MRTKQEYLDLLQETIDYYGEDPSRRSLRDGEYECIYTDINTGNHCAVGRCLTKESQTNILEAPLTLQHDIVNESSFKVAKYSGLMIFEEKYQGFHDEFWMALQDLHDKSVNWNVDGTGITLSGREAIQDISDDIEGGEFGHE